MLDPVNTLALTRKIISLAQDILRRATNTALRQEDGETIKTVEYAGVLLYYGRISEELHAFRMRLHCRGNPEVHVFVTEGRREGNRWFPHTKGIYTELRLSVTKSSHEGVGRLVDLVTTRGLMES